MPPANGGCLCPRYFTPNALHHSLAVNGAIALLAAALTPGSVGHKHLGPGASCANSGMTKKMVLESFPGNTVLEMQSGPDGEFTRALIVRTARMLAKLTAHVFPGSSAPSNFHLT